MSAECECAPPSFAEGRRQAKIRLREGGFLGREMQSMWKGGKRGRIRRRVEEIAFLLFSSPSLPLLASGIFPLPFSCYGIPQSLFSLHRRPPSSQFHIGETRAFSYPVPQWRPTSWTGGGKGKKGIFRMEGAEDREVESRVFLNKNAQVVASSSSH